MRGAQGGREGFRKIVKRLDLGRTLAILAAYAGSIRRRIAETFPFDVRIFYSVSKPGEQVRGSALFGRISGKDAIRRGRQIGRRARGDLRRIGRCGEREGSPATAGFCRSGRRGEGVGPGPLGGADAMIKLQSACASALALSSAGRFCSAFSFQMGLSRSAGSSLVTSSG